MSWRVRNWIAYDGKSRTRRAPVSPDTDLEAANNALGDVDRDLRNNNRALFLIVDRIKARPGRRRQPMEPFDPSMPVSECLWCGDTFPIFYKTMQRDYCKRACKKEHQRFLRGRQ